MLKKSIFTYGLIGILLISMSMIFNLAEAANQSAKPDIRLYTLNCGYIDIHDASSFFEPGFCPHKSMRLADPCFLIKHPKGWMLWDLGLGDQYAAYPNHTFKDDPVGITMIVPQTLTAQLKTLGLTPQDIKFIGLSHAHFDHTGNAPLFVNSTWLLQRAEYQFMQQKPLSPAVESSTFATLKNVHKKLLNGYYDVFGDSSVVILSTPGHTPGHQSLKLMLPHMGLVILSGDLYHTRLSYLYNQVPSLTPVMLKLWHQDSR